MKTVYVAFPVQRGSKRFLIEKGRRWSLVEHILLDAVCEAPKTAANLSEQSALPRRVVVEAFIRLMHAGWVEIVNTTEGPAFRATPLGVVRSDMEALPAVTSTKPKWRGFAIEQITGGAFRSRELEIRTHGQLPVANENQAVVQLPPSPLHLSVDLEDVFSAIEGEDELVVGVDRSPEKLADRFAVVTVRGSQIEGLPTRANPALRNLILARAAEAVTQDPVDTTAEPGAPAAPVAEPESDVMSMSSAVFDHEDLIIDGQAHADLLQRLLKNARERIIIHSTFMNDAATGALLPDLMQAVARGARVDLLWGQDEVGSSTSSSRAAAQRLREAIAAAGRSDAIRIHPFSTESHAKAIVADNGRGGWVATVGSSNWLSSDLASFETSIRLRDRRLIAELTRKIGTMAKGRPGIWNEFAMELTLLARQIADGPQPKGRTAKMKLLFEADHAEVVLAARDRAKARIFALSHRIGIAARPVTILPTLAALAASNLSAEFYYGRSTGPLSGVGTADLTRELSAKGVAIKPVYRPRLHAKVFGWDDDFIAVSSLNWLSVDPADSRHGREIGVLLEAPKIADHFLRVFQQARLD